jgi:glycosyltransferase involved in cell wall biosynthesis
VNSALRVAVAMPSLNQARFIRQAIDSVLDQDYEPISLLVMDGGSTDGTLDILKSYGDRLSFVSQRDRGQSHAVNQGLLRADGDIVCWLNSDDSFAPHAIRIVVDEFTHCRAAAFVYGKGWNTNQAGDVIGDSGVLPFDLWRLIHHRNFIQQPSCFFRKSLLDQSGLLDEDLHYVMDWDLWIRFSAHKGLYLDDYLSCNRTYAGNKTQSGQWRRWREIRRMIRRYTSARWPPVLTLYGLEAVIQSLRPQPLHQYLDWPLSKLFAWRVAQNISGRYADGGVAPVFHFSLGQPPGAPRVVKMRLTPLSKFDRSRIGCAPIIISWKSAAGDRGTFSLQENGRTQEFKLALSRPVTYPYVHFRCRADHPGQLIEAGAGLARRRIIGFLDDVEAFHGCFDQLSRFGQQGDSQAEFLDLTSANSDRSSARQDFTPSPEGGGHDEHC